MDTFEIDVGARGTTTSRARKRGSELIEFAVASLVLLAFLFGIIDFGRVFYSYEFVTYAARAGARYASVRGSACQSTNGATWCGTAAGATAAQIQTYVQSLNLPGIDPSALTATTTWPTTGASCNTSNPSNSPGCPVKVLVQYPYLSSIASVRVTTLTLTANSQMVISQ